jgi:uncharacterized membrane protein YkvA (DUF1232 family)
MAGIRVTFTLGESDLSHLRRLIRRATEHAARETEGAILAGAEKLAKEVRGARPPEYVAERAETLEALVRMVQDQDYGLPTSQRKRVLGALAYFAHPKDLIPDSIPGLGFLDDAIMVELVAQDLRHELWGYGKFVAYRKSAVQRPWTAVGQSSLQSKLAKKRREIRAAIQSRAAKEAERAQSTGGFLGRLW